MVPLNQHAKKREKTAWQLGNYRDGTKYHNMGRLVRQLKGSLIKTVFQLSITTYVNFAVAALPHFHLLVNQTTAMFELRRLPQLR